MTKEYACSLAQFKADTERHQMEVLKDDGLHRGCYAIVSGIKTYDAATAVQKTNGVAQ